MVMTQSEAEAKWCPMVRYEGDVAGSWNAGLTNENRGNDREGNAGKYRCTCIANRCAMWRWYDLPSAPDRRGFCGLAGSPAA